MFLWEINPEVPSPGLRNNNIYLITYEKTIALLYEI